MFLFILFRVIHLPIQTQHTNLQVYIMNDCALLLETPSTGQFGNNKKQRVRSSVGSDAA